MTKEDLQKRYSCVYEFLGTMQPEDELRNAIENVFEGNFRSPEEDADLICGCFLQDKKQIDKLEKNDSLQKC